MAILAAVYFGEGGGVLGDGVVSGFGAEGFRTGGDFFSDDGFCGEGDDDLPHLALLQSTGLFTIG